MSCARRGNFEACKKLLDRGADLALADFHHMTALHIACELGHHDIIRLLVKSGANVNAAAYKQRGTRGWKTCLRIAYERGDLDLAELLVNELGCDPDGRPDSTTLPLGDAEI